MFNVKIKVTSFFLSFIGLFLANIFLITGIISDTYSDKSKIPGDISSLQTAVYAQESAEAPSEADSLEAELPDTSPEDDPYESSILINAAADFADEPIYPDASYEESYPSGFYVIGQDMPEGIYKLTAYEGQAAFYRISRSIKEEYYSIADNDVFNTFSYIRVVDGEYLTLVDASAVPLEKAESGFVLQLKDSNGKYLVGKDIEAGSYTVIPDDKSGYVEIALSPVKSVSDILFSRIIHESVHITLAEGQYIKLSSASLEIVK